MGFQKGVLYELVDAKGLASTHRANPELVNDILETGGIIIPFSVSPNGDVIGITYGDGSYNYYGSLWSSESRFFKITHETNKKVSEKYPRNTSKGQTKQVGYENITAI